MMINIDIEQWSTLIGAHDRLNRRTVCTLVHGFKKSSHSAAGPPQMTEKANKQVRLFTEFHCSSTWTGE